MNISMTRLANWDHAKPVFALIALIMMILYRRLATNNAWQGGCRYEATGFDFVIDKITSLTFQREGCRKIITGLFRRLDGPQFFVCLPCSSKNSFAIFWPSVICLPCPLSFVLASMFGFVELSLCFLRDFSTMIGFTIRGDSTFDTGLATWSKSTFLRGLFVE